MNYKNPRGAFQEGGFVINGMSKRKDKIYITGFTLLFTLLIISISLSISVGVSNLLREEIKLSGTAKDSQLAFYAADSGTECALYWHTKERDLLLSAGGTCSGVNIPSPGNSFNLSFDNGTCTSVDVSTVSGITITSRGYSTCDSSNLRRTERGLQVIIQ